MSFPAMAWAVRQKLPCTQKIVLLMLAERHNKDTGQCNPSHDLLADDCGLTRRSVMDQVAKLSEAGYLRIRHRSANNVKLPNQYVLMFSFGIQEQVKDYAEVVNDVHKGSEAHSLRVVKHVPEVVNDVHKGSEPAAHKPVIEPSIEPIPKKSASAPAIARPVEVGEQVWADWVQLRKAKRATVSLTVIAEARGEAEKAGMTLDRFLSVWCARGSQGLMADWLKPNERQAGASGETAYQRSMREKMEQIAPSIAARNPNTTRVIDINPTTYFENLAKKQLENHHA